GLASMLADQWQDNVRLLRRVPDLAPYRRGRDLDAPRSQFQEAEARRFWAAVDWRGIEAERQRCGGDEIPDALLLVQIVDPLGQAVGVCGLLGCGDVGQ